MVRRPLAHLSIAPAGLAALLLCCEVSGQTPPGLPVPHDIDVLTASPGAESAAGLRLALGDEALRAGRAEEAADHYLAALQFHPSSAAILGKLLRAAADDDDARCQWGHDWWLATADERGNAKLDRETKDLLGKDASQLRKLAVARAKAVEEVTRYATKLKTSGRSGLAQGIMARWASDLGWELARPAPALLRKYGAALTRACDRHKPDMAGVVKALKQTAETASRAGTSAASDDEPPDPAAEAAAIRADDLAIGAARVLTGLSAQANFPKLEGPRPPDLGLDAAAATRSRLRSRVARRTGAPLTVSELQQMTPSERAEFTEQHRTWANPGVAVSPNGLYVVHTICGHETLLGTANTVELHHQRLVSWYGADPFSGRQGIVRIVPESADLESEGTPFWWAGGFQSGDLTTLRFSWGNISGLGRGLTHELTHRFDGAIFAFMPSWLIEGRAVWTAAAYGSAGDDQFIDNYLDWGGAQTPFVKGYGGLHKLEQLIEGTIEDYRDNYSAGGALFAYLSSWEVDGQKVYREKLQKFMRNARAGRKKPLQFFESHFADGEDGRPEGMQAFADEFRGFLRGCYNASWGEDVPEWISRYTRKRGASTRNRLVLDEPSWSWARSRAEPWFGQQQAANAGMVLAAAGQPRPAAAALAWSLETDGWHPAVTERLADLLTELRIKDAAWVLRQRLPAQAAAGTAPSLSKLPKVSVFLRELRQAATERAAQGKVLAARALEQEHNRVANLCGVEPLQMTELSASATALYPLIEPARNLGVFGWVEDRLVGYEERRAEGLWFETDDGDLHVGRHRPRDNTGLLDQRAHQRDAFVRTATWQQPGKWVFRARVHFTTSFVRGAFVINNTRRDRNTRVNFRAGDFLYSIGRKDGATETDKVRLNVDARWERDNGHLPGAAPGHTVEFPQPSSFFDLELTIDGPVLHVTANGDHVFSYTAPDGQWIEGSVGVAMGQGAVRLQRPTIQRLDRGPAAAPRGGVGFDLSSDQPTTLEEMLRRPVSGVEPSSNGTFALVVPKLENHRRAVRRSLAALRVLKRHISNTRDYPQRWLLLLPASLEAATAADLRKAAMEIDQELITIGQHHYGDPFDPHPWLLFVDGIGVLRAAESMAGARGIPGSVSSWARRYRQR